MTTWQNKSLKNIVPILQKLKFENYRYNCINSLKQRWTTSFARGPSSEISQNKELHDCTHDKLYGNKAICC